MTKKTLSMGDEAARALRVSEERPRREESRSRRCRSQLKLSRGYVFCANQVMVSRRYRGIPYRVAHRSLPENIFSFDEVVADLYAAEI